MRLPFTRSKDVASDAERVRAKLATVEREIEQAEAGLRQVSLTAALSDDPDAGYDAIARLNALRSKRELLSNALQAAEQAERDATAALHAREWQARRRALSQHLGRLERDASDVSAALRASQEAQNRLAAS